MLFNEGLKQTNGLAIHSIFTKHTLKLTIANSDQLSNLSLRYTGWKKVVCRYLYINILKIKSQNVVTVNRKLKNCEREWKRRLPRYSRHVTQPNSRVPRKTMNSEKKSSRSIWGLGTNTNGWLEEEVGITMANLEVWGKWQNLAELFIKAGSKARVKHLPNAP